MLLGEAKWWRGREDGRVDDGEAVVGAGVGMDGHFVMEPRRSGGREEGSRLGTPDHIPSVSARASGKPRGQDVAASHNDHGGSPGADLVRKGRLTNRATRRRVRVWKEELTRDNAVRLSK